MEEEESQPIQQEDTQPVQEAEIEMVVNTEQTSEIAVPQLTAEVNLPAYLSDIEVATDIQDLDIDIIPLEYLKLIRQSSTLSQQPVVRQKALELAKYLMIKHKNL